MPGDNEVDAAAAAAAAAAVNDAVNAAADQARPPPNAPPPTQEEPEQAGVVLRSAKDIALITKRRNANLPELTKSDAAAWQTFKRHFDETARWEKWDDEEKAYRLRTAMKGKALELTSEHWLHGSSFKEQLAEFERLFLSPAASQTARSTFLNARQQGDESLEDWHSRCLRLYKLAFPADANVLSSPFLISQFIKGLRSRNVHIFVHSQAPQNYQKCLDLARNMDCALMSSRGEQEAVRAIAALALDDEQGVAGLQDRPAPGQLQLCWNCGLAGHFARDCRRRPAQRGRSALARGAAGGFSGRRQFSRPNAGRGQAAHIGQMGRRPNGRNGGQKKPPARFGGARRRTAARVQALDCRLPTEEEAQRYERIESEWEDIHYGPTEVDEIQKN